MQPLKHSVILPALFCGIEVLVWYWDLHSVASVRISYGGFYDWETAATAIRSGLDFPPYCLWGVVALPLSVLLDGRVPRLLVGLSFLLCVVGWWRLIGNWLDHRGEVEDKPKPEGLLSCPLFPPLVIMLGLVALFYSFAVHWRVPISSFILTIQVALLQTWAVFLVGIPAVGMIRRYLEQGRNENSSNSTPRAHKPMSNFRLFELIVGVFVVLLLLSLPPGPLIPR